MFAGEAQHQLGGAPPLFGSELGDLLGHPRGIRSGYLGLCVVGRHRRQSMSTLLVSNTGSPSWPVLIRPLCQRKHGFSNNAV